VKPAGFCLQSEMNAYPAIFLFQGFKLPARVGRFSVHGMLFAAEQIQLAGRIAEKAAAKEFDVFCRVELFMDMAGILRQVHFFVKCRF